MDHSFAMSLLVVALALLFGFTNGFHDSASQVATVIASRALSPEIALSIAAAADFLGAYFLGTSVAVTIGRGIVDPEQMRSHAHGAFVLISALCGAISWNFITWYFGMPSSSSHALIGGLIGAFIAGWGLEPVQWGNVRNIVAVMLISPFVGFFLTYFFTRLTFFFTQWSSPRANRFFNGLQIFSLIGQSLAHGSNDGQKTMGIIVFSLVLLNFHQPSPDLFVPRWVVLVSSLTISFGIICGGWKIIRTLGSGLFRVRPIHSFASQTSSGNIMLLSTLFGFPVSTTQIISSSIMGAGAAFRPKAIRWMVARDMAAAWLVTIPASGVIASGFFLAMKSLFP